MNEIREKRKNLFGRLMEMISACMLPIIPVLISGGLLKLVIILLNFTGVFSSHGQTKEILNAISDAPFYFLPILVALSSAKHFQVNPVYAITSVSVMLLPNFIKLMEYEGSVAFFHIPVYQASYSYSALPIILLIYIMSLIIKGLEKILPDLIKDIFLPVLAVLSTTLLGVLLIGPITALLSGYLSNGLTYLQIVNPIIAWTIIDALIPVLIITGMHWVFVSIVIAQLGANGVESGFMVGCFILTMTLTASSLAVFLKTKQTERKKTAASSALTCFFTGTSEPCLFGVCLAYRIPLITTMIAGGAAGFFQGLVTIRCYIYTFPTIFSVLMFASPEEPHNLFKAVIAGGIGFAVSFLLTYLFYKDEKISNPSQENAIRNL